MRVQILRPSVAALLLAGCSAASETTTRVEFDQGPAGAAAQASPTAAGPHLLDVTPTSMFTRATAAGRPRHQVGLGDSSRA